MMSKKNNLKKVYENTCVNDIDEASRRYFDFYHLVPIGYFTLDKKGVIKEANPMAAKLFGLSISSVINKPLSDFVVKEDQGIYYQHCKNFFATGETQSCEVRIEKSNATKLWVYLSGVMVTNEKGVSSLHVSMHDISECKRIQEEIHLKDQMILAQAKQEAMGEIISMLAHQWRQPLFVVGMAVNNMKASLDLDEKVTKEKLYKYIDIASEEVQELSQTIEKFSNFFRPNQSKEKIAIEEILNGIVAVVGENLKESNIELTIHNTAKSFLFVSKCSLIQVLLNIINNAKEALLLKQVKQAAIRITVKESKDMVVISICDNAGGVHESIMDKIFKPYFTTKEQLNGAGLGLYVSQTIVEKHLYGTLKWHNDAKGACFVISIKIAQ